MLRSIFALIAGLFATMGVITGVELVSAKWLFPPPAGLDYNDPAAVNAFVASLPLAALLVILGAWLVGTFIGAAVAARLAGRYPVIPAMVIACLVVAGTIANAMNIQHPTWMLALAVLLPIPLALLAVRLVRRVSPAPGK